MRSSSTDRWSSGSSAHSRWTVSVPTPTQGVVLDVAAEQLGEVAGVVGHLRTAAAAAPVVDQPAVGDGEDPGPQRRPRRR